MLHEEFFQFCQFQKGKSLSEGCILCCKDERGHNEPDEVAQVFKGPVCPKKLISKVDGTPTVQKKKRVDTRGERKETTVASKKVRLLFSARANYLEIKLKLHVFQESKPFNINTV